MLKIFLISLLNYTSIGILNFFPTIFEVLLCNIYTFFKVAKFSLNIGANLVFTKLIVLVVILNTSIFFLDANSSFVSSLPPNYE